MGTYYNIKTEFIPINLVYRIWFGEEGLKVQVLCLPEGILLYRWQQSSIDSKNWLQELKEMKQN